LKQALASQGDPYSLWRVLWRRSERLPEAPNRPGPELDICHLFTGHDLRMGSKFVLSAENQTPGRNVTFTIGEVSEEPRAKTAVIREGLVVPSRFGLHVKGNPAPAATIIGLSRNGGLTSDSLEVPRRLRRNVDEDNIPSQFITAESYSGTELVSLWEGVSLTSNEERVLEPVYDLLSSSLRNAKWIICRLVFSLRSQFFQSRRHFSSQPKDRSTIQRLGSTANVCSSLRLTT